MRVCSASCGRGAIVAYTSKSRSLDEISFPQDLDAHVCLAPISPASSMKFTVTAYHAVATWKWDTSTEPHKLYHYAKSTSATGSGSAVRAGVDDYDDEAEDDVCGICRLAFESCCPDCKVPGDDCPLSEHPCFLPASSFGPASIQHGRDGEGAYVLMRACSMGRMHAHLPHALPAQVDRDRVVEAAVSDGPQTVG